MDADARWAIEQFGKVELGDKRRTQRAVALAQAMARRPSDGLMKQTGEWNGQRGAYRLLDNAAVNHTELSRVHWQTTQEQAGQRGSVILMVQDITELDYSAHAATEGLGPIGDHRGRGRLVHNTLAIEPKQREVIGLAYQQVWVREEHPHKGQETRLARQHRATRQSQRWVNAVHAVGTPPQAVRWVHVADRESDIFPFFAQVKESGADFCVRIVQNRRLAEWSDEAPRYLLAQARQLAAMGERTLDIPAKPGQAARQAALSVSWQQVSLRSPRNAQGAETFLTAWVVRTWEAHPPTGATAIEWLLLSSVPVDDLQDALERIGWYTCRWIVEEYHSCLKTGCAIEKSQLQHADRLQRLLAFLSILAVRLLQLRDLSRLTPHLLARQAVQGLLVQLVAHRIHVNPNTLTLAQFWSAIAGLGGFPARKSDGQPGWKRLWHGWLRLLDLAEGASIALSLPSLLDVGNP
jgi:Transposase DNA-binding